MAEVLIGLVSISDRASAGIYEDKGIPALNDWFAAALKTPWRVETRLIPDEQAVIERTLIELVDTAGCDLVLTTGGTGPASRDVTPEATVAVAHKVMPGFGEQMRQVSLRYVPTAILSRQVGVIRNRALILNLPGQPKAIKETLDGVFPAVPYCIDLIGGPYIETDEAVCKAFRPKSAVRPAHYYLHAQVENGTQCPLTMTFAATPVLRRHADVASIRARWLPLVESDIYDPSQVPVTRKRSALIGMGMTERQGGSDVRANRTRAIADGDRYRITGHKWFFSAPQCDAHLVLAQTEAGIGCFFMPRFQDDGARNGIRIERLKDKLGNRSNASAEVTFEDAHAWLLGDPGRGVATILEMVQLTRLDCVIGSAGMMRSALAWALHWAAHRVAFGARLIDQPLMTNVLADLALETEAALRLALDL